MATVFTLAGAFAAGPGYLTSALRGTITDGNTVVPILYPNWTIFEAQVDQGASMLDTALNSTTGEKVVFGHSLGAVVASNWLKNYGPTSGVSDLSFVLIGNSVRKYGGELATPGIGALFFPNSYPIPADTPYTVTDFARQYDGFADFPQLTGGAVDNMWALLNSVSGEGGVHPYYNDVALDDAANVRYTVGNISWVWSPTWPLPLFGISQNAITQIEDEALRSLVEGGYSRPVSLSVDYSGSPWTQAIRPSGIASGIAFGTVNAQIVGRVINPDGIGTDGLFGETWIWHAGTITPKGIQSGENFGNVTLPYPATVIPTSTATRALFGTPTITG
jgi:hypothetical protein